MDLSDRGERVECAARGLGYERSLPASILALMREQRTHATCAACQTPIALGVRIEIRGTDIFHPGCVPQRVAPSPRRPQVITPTAPRVIAVVGGVFMPTNSPHSVYDRRGFWVMESIGSGAFRDAERDPRNVTLRFDHEDAAISGRCLWIDEQQGEYRFAFELHDSPGARLALASIRDNSVRGLSAGVTKTDGRMDNRNVTTILAATLTEISMVTRNWPAFSGTWIRALS